VLSVLIVCEQLQVLESLERALSTLRVMATVACDAAAAKIHLQRNSFDAIFIDYMLTDRDACDVDALRLLSGSEATLIAITNSGAQQRSAFSHGALFSFPPLRNMDQANRCVGSVYRFLVQKLRRSTRIRLDQPCRITSDVHIHCEATMLDISTCGFRVGGCSVELRQGATVSTAVVLPGQNIAIDLTARIIWTSPGGQFGAQITHIPADRRRMLEAWIVERAASLGTTSVITQEIHSPAASERTAS